MIAVHLQSEAENRKVKSLDNYTIILYSKTTEAFHSSQK